VVSLAAYGTGVLPTLGKVLANELEELPVRRAVARVLGRIPAREAVSLIVRHLDAADEELRVRLYRSLARLMRSHQLPLGDPAPVRAVLVRELQRAWEALQAAEVLGLEDRPLTVQALDPAHAQRRLLGSALREKVERIEQRAFVLLAVLFPEAGMEHIVAGLRRGGDGEQLRRRANAVELLDNLLDRPLKRILLPLLDEAPREVKLAAVMGQVPLLARDPGSALRRLQGDENAWVRACALWLTAHLEPQLLEELLPSATTDVSPVVRETALAAAGQHLAPERARILALELATDVSPPVSLRAKALLGGAQRSVA
jgi:HEAT repeat protein